MSKTSIYFKNYVLTLKQCSKPGDRTASHPWSVSWDSKNVTEFLFTSVNLNIEPSKQYWLIMKKNDLMGEGGNRYYDNKEIPIVASTTPYSAKQ